MDDESAAAVAARVVAWHNRHPLARRIVAAQVESVGWVALPFVRGGGRRAERAFSEDFVPPLRPARVARWARRFGRARFAPPATDPVRVVHADPTRAGGTGDVFWLHTGTAAVVHGGQRVRLLLGAGARPAVIGPRLWSPVRLGALLGGLLLAAVGAGQQQALQDQLQERVGDGLPVLPASAAGGAASAAATDAEPAAVDDRAVDDRAADEPVAPSLGAASAGDDLVAPPLHAAGATTEATEAPGPASEPAPPASAAAPASPLRAAVAAPPRRAAPGSGRLVLPALRPLLDEATRAQARKVSGAARAERAATRPAPASAPGPAPAPAPIVAHVDPPLPLAVPADGRPLFALSSRVMRTRAESELVLSSVRTGVLQGGGLSVRVELMPSGDNWRVVAWPFSRRVDADKMRSIMAGRGLRVETVEF